MLWVRVLLTAGPSRQRRGVSGAHKWESSLCDEEGVPQDSVTRKSGKDPTFLPPYKQSISLMAKSTNHRVYLHPKQGRSSGRTLGPTFFVGRDTVVLWMWLHRHDGPFVSPRGVTTPVGLSVRGRSPRSFTPVSGGSHGSGLAEESPPSRSRRKTESRKVPHLKEKNTKKRLKWNAMRRGMDLPFGPLPSLGRRE